MTRELNDVREESRHPAFDRFVERLEELCPLKPRKYGLGSSPWVYGVAVEAENDRFETALDAAAQAILVAAGVGLGATHPDLAVPAAGGFAGAGVVVSSLLRRVFTFKATQMVKAVAAGSAYEGVGPQVLADKAAGTEFKQLVTAEMLEAATRSAYEAKIVALGRAWARGVASEEEAVLAIEQQFIRTVSRLEVAHVRTLGVVARTPTTGKQLRAVVTGWEEEAVKAELPEYGPMVGQLLAMVSSEGLIANTTIQNPMSSGTQFRITAAGVDVLSRLADAEASLAL